VVSDFAELAEPMCLIFPERKIELHIDDEQFYNRLKTEFQSYWPGGRIAEIVYYAKLIKVLFPERISDLHLNDKSWEKIKETARENFDINQESSQELKFIFPNYDLEAYPTFKKSAVEDIKKDLRYTEKGGERYAQLAVLKKILFPNTAETIDRVTWEDMKNTLLKPRVFIATDFSRSALNMKILAAKEIKITDNGVEIIMPEQKASFEKALPSLPETRNF